MSGRSPRRKGDRVEREVVRRIQAAGLAAKRVPLSGSATGYPGDVVLKLRDQELCIEVKARADFKTLYGWLEQRDALVLKGDRRELLVVLRLETVLGLLAGGSARAA